MTDLTKLESYVKEVALGMQRRSDATSFMRDVLDKAKQDGFDKKQIRKLAKLYIDRNASQVRQEVNELVDTFEELSLQ